VIVRVLWLDIVASEVDGVGTGNLEEDALSLTDHDIEWLLVVLG
jgi:hypothetical protein